MNAVSETMWKAESVDNQTISTERVATCYLCRVPGHHLYRGLSDRLFGVPGEWALLRCPDCGFVWLSPRPASAEISKVYRTYYTHNSNRSRFTPLWEKTRRALYSASVPGYDGLADGRPWRALGAALTLVPTLKERALLGTMCLSGPRRGRLLDIGCGSGLFLSRMREAGWQVFGVEPDCSAAKQARENYRMEDIFPSIDDVKLLDGSFDAITLSHVIEHVYDPVDLLSQCRRLLTPSGLAVVLTPNIESLGHQIFTRSWYALDPPRHLHLFSSKTLKTCCEKAGLHVRLLRTSARMAHWVGPASEVIRDRGVFDDSKRTWGTKCCGLAFQVREELALHKSREKGEELVLIASPTSTASNANRPTA